MVWYLLPTIILGLSLAILVVLHRRAQLKELHRQLVELKDAKKRGSHTARLQYPHVDLTRCLGCGTCIRACPEEGVLDLVHGQAAVIHGARCVGHGLCAQECPTGAIQVTLGDLEKRTDIPVLGEQFEAVDQQGLFLAGEVTGFALIRTAITHGAAVADEVHERTQSRRQNGNGNGIVDLCVVGAGPSGLAASLRAKQLGLNFVTVDQEGVGGTVSKYPRRKLVMTQPVDLPLHGRLRRTSYSKEQLMDLWEELAQRYELPIQTQTEYTGLEQNRDGTYIVYTNRGDIAARHVCLCLGRRGTPRKLGIPGEDLSKVTYSLVDAQSYQDRRILVVGGGDSAVEAALGLAEQPGNRVTISYRKEGFFRIKARNQTRVEQAIETGKLQCMFRSQPREITLDTVRMTMTEDGADREFVLANDDVFIMAGGIPPFKLLEASGVSFEAHRRQPAAPFVEQGTGLLIALCWALGFALAAFSWIVSMRGYYELAPFERPGTAWHELLKPSGTVGLTCGALAAGLMVANLCYLLRRSRWGQWVPGSLQAWMTSHVGTGMLALLLVVIHSAMIPKDTVGGHALIALVVLVLSGGIGRYLYSFIPRAANGRELALEEIGQMVASEAAEWDQQGHGLGEEFRNRIGEISTKVEWKRDFFGRLYALLTSERRWKRVLTDFQGECKQRGLAPDQIERLVALGERAYRTSLSVAHYEDLRSLLASWRYVHRWVALLMVLLLVTHITAAFRYSRGLP